MIYLLTGGAGFIGSHTVDALLARGSRVRVFDNFSTGRHENLPSHPGLEVIAGDIRNAGAVNQAMSDVTHVLHLAAQVSVAASVESPPVSADHNITGFLNVLDAARRSGVRRFIYASSAAVYGTPAALPISEATPARPLSPYGLEKLVNDQYARLFSSLYGLPTLGVRYFNVYGPRQDPHSPYSGVISIFCDRLRAGQPLILHGDGRQTRDFISVSDVARANVAALDADLTGVCNIATGCSTSLLQLAATLGTVGKRTPALEFAPARSGDIRNSSADNRRLVEALGVCNFSPLSEGLQQLWNATGN